MLLFKLALKNILGAGVRTWLNVIVLSFSFVAIIWTQGMNIGMLNQASHAMIAEEIAGGQYWEENYDPYDPFALEESRRPVPPSLDRLINRNQATAILTVPATIYPQGRIQPVQLNGIDPNQSILDFPANSLSMSTDDLPLLIGTRMAKNTHLQEGEYITVRWRDADGTFDAIDGQVVKIMYTAVQSMDQGQVWVPLHQLQAMMNLPDHATRIVISQDVEQTPDLDGWTFRSQDYLLQDIRQIVESKTIGSTIFYIILLSLAMLAIFDTQILAIFRRRKEIGTLVALGMTRAKVIILFTIEGAMHGILAALVGAIYGIPLLYYTAEKGWTLPESMDDFGIAISQTLYPTYSAGLVSSTVLIVMITVTIVSFLPTRKIAKLKPTDALRGKRA